MAESLFPDVRDDAAGYLRSGVSVTVAGLPGSGRSRLLRGVVEDLVGAGWEALEIHGGPALRARPLEALAVAGLLDPRQGAGTPVAAAVAAIRRAVERERTVVVVDDADLLDETSGGAIVAALHGRRVPLLSCTSIARRAPEFSLAAHVRPSVRLVMPPLAFADSTELIEQLCRGPVAVETAARIHAKSGGLPGLIEALVDNALREGLLVERGGTWRGAASMWSTRLAGVVESLLQGLTSSQFDALAKLSLVGSVDVAVARRLADWADVEALDERGLLAFGTGEGGLTVTVYPPLLGEHLRRDRMGARRLRLLDEIDVTLTGRLPYDSRYAQIAPGALDGSTPRSLMPARGLGTPAPEDEENRHSLDATLNRMVFERLTAESLVRKAEWDRRQDAPSAIAYALSLMSMGAPLTEVLDVLSTPSATCDDEDRAMLAVWRALALAAEPDGMVAARAFLAEERAAVRDWAPLLDVSLAHLALVFEGIPEAGPVAAPTGGEAGAVQGVARLVRAEQLLVLGRPSAARDELDLIADEDPSLLQSAAPFRALATLESGDLDAAEDEAREGFEEGIARLDPEGIIPYGYLLALVLVLRGDDEGLREHVSTLLSVGYTPLRYSHFHLGALVAAGRVAAGAGRSVTATSLADQAERLAPTLGPYPLMAAEQGRAHARLSIGDPPQQVADALWHTAASARERGFVMNALVLGARSLELHPDRGRAERMGEWARLAEPGGLAQVLMRYADALTDTDTTAMLAAAETLASRGFDGFSIRVQVAAAALASRAGDGAAAEIARRVREHAERLGGEFPGLVRPLLQESALTAREREIAQLAAEGLSNGEIAKRLIVSTRTVENHLYRVFQKLRIDGRQQLAVALDA
ncbi:LuxR C-terminal-related transcriptional regulator [Microbacterium sp. NPDC096154]|uniref:LuxR C-terminal-related transcriptional regulator n=1 Tax=Microbacterium sp. NPDC096154 TaxID=3155549 RepID=UPI00332CD453